jgi:PAS domain S-box-containing protein
MMGRKNPMYSRIKRRLDPLSVVLLNVVFLAVFIWLLSIPSFAQAQPQAALAEKNVLILHTLESSTPLSLETNRGLLDTLRIGGIPGANLFFESMDLRRNPGPELRKLLVEQMRLKWSHRKADMVITVYPEALEFVLNDCRDVFPYVPIIALHLPQNFVIAETGRRIIGHFPTYDITGTIDNALKLVPGTKRVYVVSGAHKVDKWLEDQARRASKKWERVEFLYLSHMTVEDILATVSKAPPGSVILYLALTQDVAGKSHTGLGLAHQLSQVSTVPTFGMFEAALGYGVTGGTLISWDLVGKRAGQLAIDILKGVKTLDDVPPILDVPSVPMFDWRQLRRWNISEAALPKGSIVINREVTFWDFKYYIIGSIAILLAQTLLVIGLLVQRRRKKEAEESLQQRTEELNQFFNVTLDLLGIANTDGYFLRLNQAAERILGYTREELMAKRFLEFVHPDDLDRTQKAISTLASQQEVFSFENRYRCKDGTYRWLEWSSAPVGKLIYAAARDVTDHKRTEKTLREKEETAREMAREAFVLAEIGRRVSSTLDIGRIYEAFAAEAQKIISFDRIVINLIDSEKVTVKNAYMAGGEIDDREVEKVYPLEGSGNAEMVRTKSTFLLQTEDFGEYKDRFPMLLSTFEAGFRSIMNVPLVSKGKVIGGLLLRSRKPNAYTDKDVRVAESIGNQIAGAIAITQLFQEQKQMENRLRESEERFRQVAETVGDFIWEVDTEGLYRYTSPSVEKILGYGPDELIGKMHFYDLFVPEVREEIKTAAFNVFAAKQTFQAFQNPNLSKEGKVVHLETSGIPMLDETGDLVGYRGADTNITERKKAEKEAIEARRELLRMERVSRMGELSASLSHELNQPLTAILSNARAALRFLESGTLDLAELGEILRDIVNDDKRAGDIIRSLRTMVKPEEGERELISINDLLHETVALFRSEAIIRNVRIKTDVSDSLPLLYVDKVQIQQVLINLMMNAAESMMGDDATVKAIVLQTGTSPDGHVQVAVRDFGSGIDEQELPKVFEPFFTTKRSGLGMGLSLSRSIIESHGGHIWAGNNPDKGITFYFNLPVSSNQ